MCEMCGCHCDVNEDSSHLEYCAVLACMFFKL